jgi:hypothetical protein
MATSSPTSNISADGITFEAVNECIYCGSKNSLSREHIVPYGLHGDLVLLKSSCPDCARITSEIERSVLKGTLGVLRTRHKFRSQKDKKRRKPSEITITKHSDFGDENIVVPLDDLPTSSWTLPLIGPAGLAWPVKFELLTKDDVLKYQITEADAEIALRLAGGKHPVSLPQVRIDLNKFYRFIAKIAHSYATAILGHGSFEPLLPAVIRGEIEMVRVFVGGNEEIDPPEDFLYELSVGTLTAHTGKRYIAVKVRLFSHLGTPTYHAIVAEDKGGGIDLSKYESHAKAVKVTIVWRD